MADYDAILQAIKSLETLVQHQYEAFNKRMDDQEQDLATHMREETSQIATFMKAFPASDPIAHCAAHLEWIEEVRQRKEFYAKMRFELARWGLLGLIGWLAIQAWHGFLKGPH
jgi:hypothetical protein